MPCRISRDSADSCSKMMFIRSVYGMWYIMRVCVRVCESVNCPYNGAD